MCAHCGDRIGVYERMIVVEGELTRVTSRAREPEISESSGRLLHAGCALSAGIEPDPID